jgi:hypothetical protein
LFSKYLIKISCSGAAIGGCNSVLPADLHAAAAVFPAPGHWCDGQPLYPTEGKSQDHTRMNNLFVFYSTVYSIMRLNSETPPEIAAKGLVCIEEERHREQCGIFVVVIWFFY